jgi:rod shape-determining protein MreB and related proteins
MAIDLGTANTVIYVRGRGIVLSEPSVVAVDAQSGKVHAVGADAKRMIGRTPASISAMRPLRHGVIADFDITEQMLRSFIRKAEPNRFAHPRVVMCVPSGVTDVEKRAVEEACESAGARRTRLIEEPIAAAIGAGLAIAEPIGNLVVDIGGGTSEVAVISLGGMVVSESLRTGGYDLDEAITSYVRNRRQIAIGPQRAEQLKIEIGSACALEDELSAEIRGRDVVSGLPTSVTITSNEVRLALQEPLRAIVGVVKETVEQTPPELAGDIARRGLMLAGGGSLLRGFDELLRDETQMPAQIAASPLDCVAVGAGESLEEFQWLPASGGKRPLLRRTRQRGRRHATGHPSYLAPR